jgi:hypothetical protein
MGCYFCHRCDKPIPKGDDVEHEGNHYHDTCLMNEGIEELERAGE